MPKSTFYRLSEEKKKRILEAAKQEFLRVPYQEASINKIIKTAEIPRGSFYQYFEDKQDLFTYVLNEHHDQVVEETLKEMELAQGDFFRFIYRLIDQFLAMFQNGECGKIIFSMLDPENTRMISGIMEKKELEETISHVLEQRFFKLVDFDLLNVKNEEEGIELMNVVGALVRDSVYRMLQNFGKNQEEAICDELRGRIQFLEKYFRRSAER